MGRAITRRDFLRLAGVGMVGAAAVAGGLGLSSCSSSAKSGTATATAQGKGGEVEVTVTVEEGVITDVEVVGDNEYPNIGTVAMEELPEAIIDAQSFDVDGTAGATVTSDAIKEAGQAAYNSIMKS